MCTDEHIGGTAIPTWYRSGFHTRKSLFPLSFKRFVVRREDTFSFSRELSISGAHSIAGGLPA